jgi:hypothetical protein
MSPPPVVNEREFVFRLKIKGTALPSQAPLANATIGPFRPIDASSISRPDLKVSSPVPSRT